MVTLADIFRQFGPTYCAQFSHKLLYSHKQAMQAILQCRTAALGGHVYTCCARKQSFVCIILSKKRAFICCSRIIVSPAILPLQQLRICLYMAGMEVYKEQNSQSEVIMRMVVPEVARV